MSIRAKIEAIVYAAEEPVTPAQLAALLGEDAEAGLAAEEQTPQDAPAEGGENAAASANPDVESPAETPANDDAVAQGDGAGADGALFADEAARAKRAARDKERRVREYLQREARALIAEYAENERGMEIREVAGGYRMAT